MHSERENRAHLADINADEKLTNRNLWVDYYRMDIIIIMFVYWKLSKATQREKNKGGRETNEWSKNDELGYAPN